MRRHRFLALLIIMTLFLTACGSMPFRNGAHTTFPEEFTGDWYIPPQVREDVHKDKAGIGISEFKVNKDGVLLINDLKYKLKEAEAGLYTSDDGYYIIDLRTDGIMTKTAYSTIIWVLPCMSMEIVPFSCPKRIWRISKA